MPHPLACWNGRIVPATELSLSVADIGFLQGVTVTEMLRTFRGEIFEIDAHLGRLAHSLNACGIQLPESDRELRQLLTQVAEHNFKLITPGRELAVCLFATPGINPGYAPAAVDDTRPTLCIYSFEITQERWSKAYAEGLNLLTSHVRQIPRDIVDPTLKIRSRLHWYLADRDVKSRDPSAMALLLDEDGHVTETSVGNIILLTESGLVTPLRTKTLQGVSQQYVMRLASELGMKCTECDLTPGDIAQAREVWLTCTTGCIVPVTRFNGQTIRDGKPGPVYRQLVVTWSDRVGVNIVGGTNDVAAGST